MSTTSVVREICELGGRKQQPEGGYLLQVSFPSPVPLNNKRESEARQQENNP